MMYANFMKKKDNKTIKVIDLLDKIANGEEVPKKIKYKGDILKYDEDIKDYMGISKTGSGSFFNYLFVNNATDKFNNDEVEIIEESEQEIDIQAIEEIIDYRTSEDDLYNDNFGDFKSTINELVQAVKQLDRKYKGE